jgi:hypothetical protein
MAVLVPILQGLLQQSALVNITSAGDNAIIQGPPCRILITGINLSANNNDQIVTFYSGGSTGGQSNTILARYIIGPTAGMPGLTLPPSPDGHFSTILPYIPPWPDDDTPIYDDFVINVQPVSEGGTVGLSGSVEFKLE